jgi:hypothetical protein
MFSIRFSAVALLGVVLVALAGCGSSKTAGQNPLRVLNAFVPAQGVDGSLTINAGGSTITGTAPTPAGQFANGGGYYYIFSGSFAPVGTSPGLSTPLQLPAPVNLPGDGTARALVAAGQAGQAGVLAPQFFLIPNYTINALAIPSGDVAIRVVNVSLNSNPIGLFSTNGSVPTAALDPALASVPYGYTAVANPYVAVPLTQLTNLAVVDTTNTGSRLTLSVTNGLNLMTFNAGQAYTLYVYGQPANSLEPLTATWVLDYPL